VPREEKLRYASSVIDALKSDSSCVNGSSVLARSYVFRAQQLYDEGSYLLALEDCRQTQIMRACATTETEFISFRISADCLLQLGRYDEAVKSLQELCRLKPSLQNKVSKEIDELRSRIIQ